MRILSALTISALLVTGVPAVAQAHTGHVPAPVPAADNDVAVNPAGERPIAPPVFTTGTFAPYTPTETAITYDDKLVAKGANVAIASASRSDGKTSILIAVHGLLPNRVYGTHVHVNTCGPSPADAGPHHQNTVDPVQPSVDPEYANPENEVWLDLTTNAKGSAVSYSTVDWHFDERQAGSVIIHAEPTATHAGHAGTAGARLACVKHTFKAS